MKKIKKLESLEFKKHTILRLSEHELNAIDGGLAASSVSTGVCETISIATTITAFYVGVSPWPVQKSWAFFPAPLYTQNPSDTLIINPDGVQGCLLNEVVVIGVAP